ncbi:MarR family winged helix-turn-helix transcriptional regulator [Anaerosporobacter faecicola]|uniref:MarR family winged helix-turn-helix transcriptional regulator n=1 Tax=Anaerosporobacter faecicola TaxID=2718714 RepID=UPI00143B09D5|nr:MarR family transcriptional regulator [Anaerosporobacter faecicola]
MENVMRFRENTRRLERKLANMNKADCCCEISTTKCFMLVEIGRKPGISVKELAEKLDVDKSVVSRYLEELVKKEYVQRNISNEDRRWVTISLLPEGIKRFEKIEHDMNEKFKQVLDAIPKEQQEHVIASLEYYVEACRKVEEQYDQ